jgi:hypothetical protein
VFTARYEMGLKSDGYSLILKGLNSAKDKYQLKYLLREYGFVTDCAKHCVVMKSIHCSLICQVRLLIQNNTRLADDLDQ